MDIVTGREEDDLGVFYLLREPLESRSPKRERTRRGGGGHAGGGWRRCCWWRSCNQNLQRNDTGSDTGPLVAIEQDASKTCLKARLMFIVPAWWGVEIEGGGRPARRG